MKKEELKNTIERTKVAEMEAVLKYIIDKELFKNNEKFSYMHDRIRFILMPPPKP